MKLERRNYEPPIIPKNSTGDKMKYILKAIEGEQVRNAISWDLTIYDEEKGEIYSLTEFEYIKQNDRRYEK